MKAQGLLQANHIALLVTNELGHQVLTLAPVIGAVSGRAIADMEANIDTLSFDERDGEYRAMNFVIEVVDRVHLANIMRRVPSQDEVIRLSRRKG